MAPAPIDVSLLRKAVRAGSRALAARLINKLEPTELAACFSDLPPAELKAVVEQLLEDRTRLRQTVGAIPGELLGELAASLELTLLAKLLERLDPDEARRVVGYLDEDHRQRVLDATPRELRAAIAQLLRYTRSSAGGRMIPRFVAVNQSATVGEAIRAIRSAAADVPVFYLYVLDADSRLAGVVSLGQLVKATDDTLLQQIMVTDVVAVSPDADQEEVARVVSRRNLLAVPVVQDGQLLGLVTIDDVLDVLEQEATEDMYNMAGLSRGDRVFSAPHRSLVKRLPWNMLNLVTSLAAASVVGLFEGTIGKLVALATFMPVVAGIGGNTGNQTLTVILRGITLGELEFSSAWRALLKELLVGLSIGVVLGLAVGSVAFFWKGNAVLGLVILLAVVANLLIAALVGTAIPLSLKRLGLDPALGGSILVTMCTDVFGFLCLLGLATLFLRHLV